MATRKIKLRGKARWARVFEENRDMKGYQGAYEATDGACTMDLILTKEEFQKLKDAGSASKLKLDEDTGDRFVKLKRPFKGKFDWASGAPVVTHGGDPWTHSMGIIPNGSDVEVTVSVYDTSMTAGTRLEEVNILAFVAKEDNKDEGVPF